MNEEDSDDPISGAVIWLIKVLFVIGGAVAFAALLAAVGA